MSRQASASAVLQAAPDAPAHARRILSEIVETGRWSDGELDVPSLLLDELVSNAVRHGSAPGHPIEITVTGGGDYLRVAVRDEGPGFDPEHIPRGDPGFGIPIVDRLASRWGVERPDAGTLVWFELTS